MAPVGGNGQTPARAKNIRVAIVGVGNCASSLVQGRYYYATLVGTETQPKEVKKSAPVRGGVPLVEAK